MGRTAGLRAAAGLAVALALACSGHGVGGPEAVVVPEAWISEGHVADNTDSLAVWHGPAGQHWLLATAKETHQVIVFDAGTGRELSRHGGFGSGPGQLSRPNGIAVAGDRVFVVERDNARVQMFSLPGFESLGTFGEAELTYPYGLAVVPDTSGEGGWRVWVTDAVMAVEDRPTPDEMARRVRHYEVPDTPGEVVLAATIGERDGPGAIRVAESILADPAHGRLFIAEELPSMTAIEIYGLDDGRWTGKTVGEGVFRHQAEGLALWSCPDGSGYLIGTDQADRRTRFLVFDRESLELVGAFEGERVANTDGVALDQRASDAFPAGAFFAVHDDQAAAAFEWRQVARSLGGGTDCQLARISRFGWASQPFLTVRPSGR